jgi:hypothetical protein
MKLLTLVIVWRPRARHAILAVDELDRPAQPALRDRAGIGVVLWTRRTRHEVVTDEPAPPTPTVRTDSPRPGYPTSGSHST